MMHCGTVPVLYLIALNFYLRATIPTFAIISIPGLPSLIDTTVTHGSAQVV